MSNIVQEYLCKDNQVREKESALEELMVPSPCDLCVWKVKCADERLACKTFSVFVSSRQEDHPELFLTDGSDRKPTRKTYKEHFAYTGTQRRNVHA